MEKLVQDIQVIRKSEISRTIEKRLSEFSSKRESGNEDWFSELCFCLLTANSTARMGIKIQDNLGFAGFCNLERDELSQNLKRSGYRFWRRRADFIDEARSHKEIKNTIRVLENELEMREWLVKNIKGLGYKEASHFLRNVGFFSLAILDRHILGIMKEYGLLKQIPKTMTKKNYLEIERKLVPLAERLGMTMGELDLYLWYMRTGEVLK